MGMNRRNPPKARKPFAFRLTKEKLEQCRGMSAQEKLRWLEETHRFIQNFNSADQLARWNKIGCSVLGVGFSVFGVRYRVLVFGEG